MLQNRTVTLALGVLKKGGPCNTAADAPCGIVKPPFVYPNISGDSRRPTSDITRLLKNSPYLERVTDMDMYCKSQQHVVLEMGACTASIKPGC